MLTCFRRHRQRLHQPTGTTYTMVHYLRAGLPTAIMVEGGPGGSIALTDEECQEIMKEVDVKMVIGTNLDDLTGNQISNSQTFQKKLQKLDQRSPLQSPRSAGHITKR